MKRTRGLLMVLPLLACSNVDIEGLPTEITLTSPKATATVGEELQFTWEATGTFLEGVILDFGDGTPVDATQLPGAQSASATRTHTFLEAGTYTVTATVDDVQELTDSDSKVIEITGG